MVSAQRTGSRFAVFTQRSAAGVALECATNSVLLIGSTHVHAALCRRPATMAVRAVAALLLLAAAAHGQYPSTSAAQVRRIGCTSA